MLVERWDFGTRDGPLGIRARGRAGSLGNTHVGIALSPVDLQLVDDALDAIDASYELLSHLLLVECPDRAFKPNTARGSFDLDLVLANIGALIESTLNLFVQGAGLLLQGSGWEGCFHGAGIAGGRRREASEGGRLYRNARPERISVTIRAPSVARQAVALEYAENLAGRTGSAD